MPIPVADITPTDMTEIAILVVVVAAAFLVARRMRNGPPDALSNTAISYRPTPNDYPAVFDRSDALEDAVDEADDVDPGLRAGAPEDGGRPAEGDVVAEEETSLEDVLRELIAAPERTEFLVLQGRRGYVQFRRLTGELYAEAVSNAYLAPHDELSEEEQDSIIRLGWQDGGSRQNYARYWRDPVDVADVSKVADDTLRVYGDDPDEATIETA